MAHIKIWIHFVWTTRSREAFFMKDIKKKVIKHVTENAIKKGVYIDSIDGGKEHLHLLVSLGAKQSVSEIAQLLKGESSFWINNQKMAKGKFAWQREYFAVSVSESVLPRVREYIHSQEEHHKTKPFSEEYDEFMRKYEFHE